MEDARVAQIQGLVELILSEAQMEAVEMSCRPQGGQLYVRLLVDRVGGVSIQQCATVNRRISAALETSNIIEGGFTVEVSSPGLDRPLATKRDFERAVGEDVRVEMVVEPNRTKELQGMLLAVQPEAIVLKTGGGNITVPMGQIRTAKKALRW